MSGDNLHGHKIPSGFTKLAIGKIDPDVKLWAGLKGDDELTSEYKMKTILNILSTL